MVPYTMRTGSRLQAGNDIKWLGLDLLLWPATSQPITRSLDTRSKLTLKHREQVHCFGDPLALISFWRTSVRMIWAPRKFNGPSHSVHG